MTRPLEQNGFEYRDGAYYRTGDDTPYELRPISNMSFGYRLVSIDTPSSAIVAQPIAISFSTRSTVGRIVDISSAAPTDRAYTDQTIRLNAHCRECSDVLPVDAQFCISCGAPVC